MIRIKNIMSGNIVTMSQDASLLDAAKLLVSKSVRSIIITDRQKPIGIVNEIEIIDGIMKKKPSVKDIMSKDFMIVSPGTGFSEISSISKEGKTKKFIVVDNQKLAGIVTETDIIDAMRDFTRFHFIMQEIVLAIFGLATAFFLFYFSPLGNSIFR